MIKLAAQKTRNAPPERDSNTEQRILQAARTVFVRRGTAGARMQEIAEEAGVNQALLHYYYRSKDRLAEAVFREAAARLVPAVLQILGSEDPIEQKVEQFVHLYIDTVRARPFLPAYLIAELHHYPERLEAMMSAAAGVKPAAVVQPVLQRLEAQLAERAAAGAMRPISAEQFMTNLAGLVVIPFIARPVLRMVLGIDDAAFERFLDQRKAELPGIILNSLRP